MKLVERQIVPEKEAQIFGRIIDDRPGAAEAFEIIGREPPGIDRLFHLDGDVSVGQAIEHLRTDDKHMSRQFRAVQIGADPDVISLFPQHIRHHDGDAHHMRGRRDEAARGVDAARQGAGRPSRVESPVDPGLQAFRPLLG